jgi:tetratricopeptide (TPR) repeat protein
LLGRDLAERLLIQDSIQHFDKAISLDPNFALAHLNRANVSPTAKEFFDHLKHAVSLADKASEGERLLIIGTEAGANGNAAKQKETLEKLVAAYPNDERAHFTLGGYYFGQQDLKNYDQAIAELQQTNLQNPQNLYRLAQAYQGKGDAQKSKEFSAKAAAFNSLPQLNYAFIRNKAAKQT